MNFIPFVAVLLHSLLAFPASFKFNHGICSRSLIGPDQEWLYLKQEKLDELVNKIIKNDENTLINEEEMNHLVNFTVGIAKKDGAKIKIIGEYRTEKFNVKDYNRAFYRLAEAKTNYPTGPYYLKDLEIRDFYLHHANRLNDDVYKNITTVFKPRKYIDDILTKNQGWKKEETEALTIYKGVRDSDYVVIAKEGLISQGELTKISQHLANGKVYFDELGEIYYASQAQNINDLITRWEFMNNKVIEDPEFGRILFCKDTDKCLQVKHSIDPTDYEKPFTPKEKDNIWYYLHKKMDGDITEY